MAAETSQTLDRGLRVLMALAARPQGSDGDRAGRGARRSTGPSSTAWSARSSSTPWSAATATGRLHVGLGVLHLATAVQPVLRDVADPGAAPARRGGRLHRPPDRRRRRRGARARRRSNRPGPTSTSRYRVGARHPLDRGAAGKAILAAARARRARRTSRRPASSRPARAAWPRRCAASRGSRRASGSSPWRLDGASSDRVGAQVADSPAALSVRRTAGQSERDARHGPGRGTADLTVGRRSSCPSAQPQ